MNSYRLRCLTVTYGCDVEASVSELQLLESNSEVPPETSWSLTWFTLWRPYSMNQVNGHDLSGGTAQLLSNNTH